jgi:hypothetical protein
VVIGYMQQEKGENAGETPQPRQRQRQKYVEQK